MRSIRLTALLAALALLLLAVAAPAGAAPKRAKVQSEAGIVDIYTTLGYQSAAAAGTGVVVTPSGEILTNNHVIRGATSLRAVDVTTGRSYVATVTGYDVADDIAVLQLTGASHLKTIPLGSSTTTKVGALVTALGNAGGLGGHPSVARGTITGLHRSIVATDDSGNAETLTNLLETNAPVRPGDSGGPLFNRNGRVIGIVTAGSAGFQLRGSGRGYAIPIEHALSIVRVIEAGQATDLVHIGPTAFLGVRVSTTQDGAPGALVVGVVPGSPAEAAGLVAGDVITSFAGKTIASPDSLSAIMPTLTPGTTVAVAWTDASGTAATGQLTTGSGPPQ